MTRARTSERSPVALNEICTQREEIKPYAYKHTLNQVFNRDIIELLDFLYNQLLLIDFDHKRSASRISSSKSEFPKGILDGLRDIDGVGLY